MAESKPRIFISYSHVDKKWLTWLTLHLAQLKRDYDLDIWDDRRIAGGSTWKEDIRNAISSADIAIALLSPNYIASEFITHEEIPQMFQEYSERSLRIIPIVVRKCDYAAMRLRILLFYKPLIILSDRYLH